MVSDLNTFEIDQITHPKQARVWGARVGHDLLIFILNDVRFPYEDPCGIKVLVTLIISR